MKNLVQLKNMITGWTFMQRVYHSFCYRFSGNWLILFEAGNFCKDIGSNYSNAFGRPVFLSFPRQNGRA